MEAIGTGEGNDHDPVAAPARAFPPLAALYETEVLADGDQTTAQGHTPSSRPLGWSMSAEIHDAAPRVTAFHPRRQNTSKLGASGR